MVTLSKEKQLIDALQFRGSIHYHHGGTWQHTGRYGAGEGDESFTY